MDDLAAQLARADRLLKQRSYEDAVQVLTRVLEAEPGHPDALHNLAGIYALLRQPAQAKVYLDRLLLVMPQSSQVNLNAAMNALAMNQVELAIELSRRAVSLTPKNADAHLTLADALEAGNQFQAAFTWPFWTMNPEMSLRSRSCWHSGIGRFLNVTNWKPGNCFRATHCPIRSRRC